MHDVVIIGGGPGGSTCAGFLRKHNPNVDVVVLEREKFPREHVGESQLPPLSHLLNELGCWDEIEKANFPIKIGATYKWGKSPELWDFDFYPAHLFTDEPRPAKYGGQREWTAFQVDRAKYDEILLNHARKLGATVREETKVVSVMTEGDSVTGLKLGDGSIVEAKYYVDASGHSGILRRALGVETDIATSLQNVAFWDYWQNADWAIKIGVGGTRVQVVSIWCGWIWFIPLGPTRTSVGLVIPKDYYAKSGKKPEEIYREALETEPMIKDLMTNAVSEGLFQTTKDWSFISKRHCGDNWFLAGESGGFADPILAAGLTMTQFSAKECALTMGELLKSEARKVWLLDEYDRRQKARIWGHIRFADFWYSSNAQFTDLKAFTAQIAKDSGLELTPDKAWQWLAQGGFIDDDANLGPAGFTIDQVKDLGEFLTDVTKDSLLKKCNCFELNLEGASERKRAQYVAGKVSETSCYVRGERVLPMIGIFKFVADLLGEGRTTQELANAMKRMITARPGDQLFVNEFVGRVPHALEAMASDGWVTATYDPKETIRDLPERVAKILKWSKEPVSRA